MVYIMKMKYKQVISIQSINQTVTEVIKIRQMGKNDTSTSILQVKREQKHSTLKIIESSIYTSDNSAKGLTTT